MAGDQPEGAEGTSVNSKVAANALMALLYAQALLGFSALAAAVLKDRGPVELASNVGFVSEQAPL